jgi:hypothetical protein
LEAKKVFILLIVFAAGSFFSCSDDNEVKIPSGVLDKEEYVSVLTDLALAESAANLNVKNVRIEKLDSTYAFDPLKEHHISSEKYNATARFYAEHPDLYKEVYEEVLKRLSELESGRKGTVKDSLKK